MKYNRYFANHFRDCRLLLRGHDPHRGRQVEVRMIPGEWDIVGVSDGVDTWVAPTAVSPSPMFDKVRAIMAEIRAGGDPKPHEARRRVPIDDGAEPKSPMGRVGISQPNIQQLPMKTEEARRVRRALLSPDF